jgi:hypothetical protein
LLASLESSNGVIFSVHRSSLSTPKRRTKMKPFSKIVLIALGFGLLTIALSSIPNYPAAAQDQRPPLSPVLVRDVDNAVRNPVVAQTFDCVLPDGVLDGTTTIGDAVPSGKLLVIETLTGSATPRTGQRAVLQMSITTAGTLVGVQLPLALQAPSSGTDFYSGNVPVRLYVDSGTTPKVFCSRNATTGTANFSVTYSGYLVDCGSGSGCPLP